MTRASLSSFAHLEEDRLPVSALLLRTANGLRARQRRVKHRPLLQNLRPLPAHFGEDLQADSKSNLRLRLKKGDASLQQSCIIALKLRFDSETNQTLAMATLLNDIKERSLTETANLERQS